MTNKYLVNFYMKMCDYFIRCKVKFNDKVYKLVVNKRNTTK